MKSEFFRNKTNSKILKYKKKIKYFVWKYTAYMRESRYIFQGWGGWGGVGFRWIILFSEGGWGVGVRGIFWGILLREFNKF